MFIDVIVYARLSRGKEPKGLTFRSLKLQSALSWAFMAILIKTPQDNIYPLDLSCIVTRAGRVDRVLANGAAFFLIRHKYEMAIKWCGRKKEWKAYSHNLKG